MSSRAAAAALATALALAACGEKTLNTGDAEKKIADAVEEQQGTRPERVECPDDMKAEKDESYDCKVFPASGGSVTARITMLDDAGRFRIEAPAP
jgi:predicted small lipoprotein YifL